MCDRNCDWAHSGVVVLRYERAYHYSDLVEKGTAYGHAGLEASFGPYPREAVIRDVRLTDAGIVILWCAR